MRPRLYAAARSAGSIEIATGILGLAPTWGLRPRLYAAARSAGSIEIATGILGLAPTWGLRPRLYAAARSAGSIDIATGILGLAPTWGLRPRLYAAARSAGSIDISTAAGSIDIATGIPGPARQALCRRALRGLSVLAFIGGDPFGEGVAVDAEDGGRVREVLLVAGKGLLYVYLLKLAEGLVQKDMALEHLVDQAFKSGMNQSSFPVNNRYASR